MGLMLRWYQKVFEMFDSSGRGLVSSRHFRTAMVEARLRRRRGAF